MNLGKWVLVHLFDRFINKEIESGTVRYTDDEPNKTSNGDTPTAVNKPRPVEATNESNGISPPPIIIPPPMTETLKPPSLAVTSENASGSPFSPSSNPLSGPYTAPPTTGGPQPDYFSGSHRRDSSVQLPPPAAMPTSPTSPTASTSSNFMNRLKSLSVKAKLSRTSSHEDRVRDEGEKQNDTTKVNRNYMGR